MQEKLRNIIRLCEEAIKYLDQDTASGAVLAEKRITDIVDEAESLRCE